MAVMRRKDKRQEAIRQLLDRNEVGSQEEIVALLATEGVEVTQATLSRDLRDLGVRKQGGRYLPLPREAIRHRKRLLREIAPLIAEVRRGGTIVVIIVSGAGQAPSLALSIREAELVEVLGVISDLQTIMIATGTGAQARGLARDLLAAAQSR